MAALDTIMQWNLQSYRTKFSELKYLLHTYSPVAVCLQETLIAPDAIPHPPSHYVLETNVPVRNDGHERGTAILIHRRITYRRIQLQTTLQAVAVTLFEQEILLM